MFIDIIFINYLNDLGVADAAGHIIIEGNIGIDNALEIKKAAITSTSPTSANPFEFFTPQNAIGQPYAATGESVPMRPNSVHSAFTP